MTPKAQERPSKFFSPRNQRDIFTGKKNVFNNQPITTPRISATKSKAQQSLRNTSNYKDFLPTTTDDTDEFPDDKFFQTTKTREFFTDHSNTFFLNKDSKMNNRRENYLAPQLSYEQVLIRHKKFHARKRL